MTLPLAFFIFDIFHETVSSLSQVLNLFFNFHSLRISTIYVSILAFCQVLLNEYDDDDDDDPNKQINDRNPNLAFVNFVYIGVVTFIKFSLTLWHRGARQV